MMGKKHKHLYEKIYDIDNLRLAYEKTVVGGNRYKVSHLIFKENLEANLHILQQQLIAGTYKIGKYSKFKVYEPKLRTIESLPFRDRVLQHAINNVVDPIFEKVYYNASYACRKNKGTHKAVKDLQASVRRLSKQESVYYLKMDFSRYFHSIDKKVLTQELKRKITDDRLIALLKQFMGSGETGIPIGNLTSQFLANVYGHIFDRFVKSKLKIKHYFRYMDDSIILMQNKTEILKVQRKIKKFISIFMKLRFSKWSIDDADNLITFVGYRVHKDYKLIRKDSLTRARRKIKRYTKHGETEKLQQFLTSWHSHLKTANSHNLIKNISNLRRDLCKQEQW